MKAQTEFMLNPLKELRPDMTQPMPSMDPVQFLRRLRPERDPVGVVPSGGRMFNVDLRPKDPPTFSGSEMSDIDVWLGQLKNQLALLGGPPAQQVAYSIGHVEV